MFNLRSLILIPALAMPFAAAQGTASGLLLNDDSVQFYRLGAANDDYLDHSRKQFTLALSKEPDPRNLLLMTDAELLDYQRPFKETMTLAPKIGLFFADFLDQRFFALSGGLILRQPADEQRKFGTLYEFFVAPHLTSQYDTHKHPWGFDFEWSWGFKAQINYPLPDNAEFNLGFRSINMNIEGRPMDSFETGIYFGLTHHFE